MTDETQVVEEAPEEIRTRIGWAYFKMGRGEYSLEREMNAEGETTWPLKELISEAMGVPLAAIYLDQVEFGYRDGWASNRVIVEFHIAGSKFKLHAEVKFS